MSKRIPEEIYNNKPLSRLIQWVNGDIDPFTEQMEVREPKDIRPNERLIRKHRRDRAAVIWMARDQKHNQVYKNFQRFYRVASVVCCLALIWILLESPDLAITEAAVGAGVTSLLFFVTLKKIHAMKEEGESDE